MSIRRQAELLSVSRSGLYYQPRPPSVIEVTLKHRMDELYTRLPIYGSRRMTAQLQREGHPTCRETVRRYIQEMGLEAVPPTASTSMLVYLAGLVGLVILIGVGWWVRRRG